MTQCAVWWTTPLAETSERLALLSSVERQRFAAYRKEADRRRFLTGRVLARTLAAEQLGGTPADIDFDASCPECGRQHGRPRVPGTSLELSISHSGDRIGVAVTTGCAVGLDVESTDRRAEDSLMSYVLNAAELDTVAHLPPHDRTLAFFTLWTRKEAVMKATGRGLRIPLRSITLSGPDQPPRLLAYEDSEDTGRDDPGQRGANGENPTLTPESVRLADLDAGAGYRAAVAVLTAEEIEVTQRWWSPQPVASGQ